MDISISKFKMIKNLLRAITILYFIFIIFISGLGHFYMIWNVILAWVPLEIVSLIGYINRKFDNRNRVKIATIILAILWLLFYPNSPYIITDFIHLSTNEYYIINKNYSPYSSELKYMFNDNIKIWLDFVIIGIGVWIGYVVGFISLYLNQLILKEKYNKRISWIFVLIVHFLTGFAIYIGRFSRWNSWDIIFSPINIITIFKSSINLKTLEFTLLFGSFSLILYVINYSLVELGNLNEKKDNK